MEWALDIEGVYLETPWPSNLTDSWRKDPQHMVGNDTNNERESGDINKEMLLESGERIICAGRDRTTRGKFIRNDGGVGKHGRAESPIAEKFPWNHL